MWLVACGMFYCFLFVCLALNQHNECMHTTEKPGVKDVSEPNSGSILNRKGKPFNRLIILVILKNQAILYP